MEYLPKPVVLECYWDNDQQPPLAALRLQWDPNILGSAERVWHLPQSLTLIGPAPERFGLTLVRQNLDSYAVRMLWNGICFHWSAATRVQLLTSAMAPLLRSLGQDLWQLLNQPIHAVISHPRKVA